MGAEEFSASATYIINGLLIARRHAPDRESTYGSEQVRADIILNRKRSRFAGHGARLTSARA